MTPRLRNTRVGAAPIAAAIAIHLAIHLPVTAFGNDDDDVCPRVRRRRTRALG